LPSDAFTVNSKISVAVVLGLFSGKQAQNAFSRTGSYTKASPANTGEAFSI